MRKALIAIIAVLLVTFIAFFLVRDTMAPSEQAESASVEHVYSSWEMTEFDKCVAAWLIVRFIDPDAKFVLYPHGTEITEGIVFDIPGAEWSRKHRKCTSDCILESINLDDPAVKRIVEMAHNIELNFWQLDRFPEAQKSFDKVGEIINAADNSLEYFKNTHPFFDNLYDRFKKKSAGAESISEWNCDTNFVSDNLTGDQSEPSCQGAFTASADSGKAGFQGVEFCLSCHRDKTSYMHTLHPRKIQGPPEKGRTPVLTAVIDGETVSIFDPRTKGYKTYIEPWAEYFNEDNVEYTIGGRWKQQFMTKVIPAKVDSSKYSGKKVLSGYDYAVMGMQWNVREQKWQDYRGPAGRKHQWYMDGRLARKKCTGCHATGFDPKDGTWVGQNSSFMQKGVSCESCHRRSGAGKKIVNPAKDLSFAQQVELCGSCHSRGTSIGTNGKPGSYGFPYSEALGRGYEPGDKLTDFYVQSTNPSDFWPNGNSKRPHQQWNDFMLSTHFEVEVGCISCHSIHESENLHQTRLAGDKLCVSCHEEKAELAAYQRHTGHSPQEAGCLDCHMPYTVKRASISDARSHTFKTVSSVTTITQGGKNNGFSGTVDPDHIPNSCNSHCHNNEGPGLPKTNVEAQMELERILNNR